MTSLKHSVHGLTITVPDHGGGMPVIERVMREVGQPGVYLHRVSERHEQLVAIQITLGGNGCVWPDGRVSGPGLAVPRGHCLVFRYGQPLTYAARRTDREPWDFLYVNLAGRAALAMVDELVTHHGHVLALDLQQPVVQRCLDLASGEGIRHRQLDGASAARIACDLLLAVAESQRVTANSGQDVLDVALSFLTANLAHSVDVRAAAEHCGVTREHLTRLFQRRLGVAPAAWLRGERLRHAELLLRSGTLPVATVAQRVGFATASHFIHVFRRATGHTPASLRR